MDQKAIDQFNFQIDLAASDFQRVQYALADKNLAGAKIHLDQATLALAKADDYAFVQLYIGAFYRFFANWQEVHQIINDPMLCLMEWNEFVWWVNLANAEWNKAKCIQPNPEMYNWEKADWETFSLLKQQLDDQLEAFGKVFHAAISAYRKSKLK